MGKKTRRGYLSQFPTHWKVYRMDKLLDRVKKKVDVKKTENYTQIGIRSHGKGIFYKEAVTGKELGNKSVFWVEPDCFVVNIVFAWEMAVAKTTQNDVGLIASHRFPMYKPKPELLDLDFLLYYFKMPLGKYLLGLASPGGAGRNKTLGQKEFAELEICIPPVNEQKEIVSILKTWDKAIDLKEKLIEEKKLQKEGLMQKLLSNNKELTKYNGKWLNFKVSDLCEITRGRVISKEEIKLNSGKYPVYSSQTLNDGIIGYINTYDFEGEYITWTTDGVHAGTVFHRNGKFNCTNICGVLVLKHENIDARYLTHIIQKNTHKYVVRNGNPKLMNNIMSIIPIKIYNNIDYQKKVCDIIEGAVNEISLLQKELLETLEQKRGLMQQLLTGKKQLVV